MIAGLVGGLIASTALVMVLDSTSWVDRGREQTEARLAALERLPQEMQETKAAFGATDATVSDLGQRIGALEGRPVPVIPPPVDLGPILAQIEAVRSEAESTSGELRNNLQQSLSALQSSTAGVNGALEQQRTQIAELGRRLDELGARQVDLAPVQAAIDQNKAAIRQVDQAAQQARSEVEQLSGRITRLEQALQQLEAGNQRAAHLAAALVGLDESLAAGRPAGRVLDQLQGAAPDDPAVAEAVRSLEPVRDRGPATVADLQARLDELRPRIASAEQARDGSGWIGAARRNITSLVDVHQVGQPEAASNQAVEQAANALAKGDVQAAASAIEPLAQSGNPAAQEWLTAARQRLDVQAAVERLRSYLATLLEPAR
jgi:hypothetical protein